jgi:hypothetical protein
VTYLKTEYEVNIGVADLSEVDGILQDWALDKWGVELDLPTALVSNEAITDFATTLATDDYVYINSPVSAYLRLPRFAGISGTLPVLPTALDDNGAYIVPTCLAYLWSQAGMTGYFGEYTIPESQAFIPSSGINYIGITFNAGVPMYQIYTSWASFDFSSIIPVAKVLVFGGAIYNIPWGQSGDGLPEKLLKILDRRKPYEILDPYTLSQLNLYVSLGAINVQHGDSEIACLVMDTSLTGNDMYLYYLDSSLVWQYSKVSTLNNTQYVSPLTGIQTLAGGKYVINYLYRVVGSKLLMFTVLSDTFDTLADALAAGEPDSLPAVISASAVCVGRVVLLKSATTGVVQRVSKVQFAQYGQ